MNQPLPSLPSVPQSNHPSITILEQLIGNLDPNETLQFNTINGMLHIVRTRGYFIPGNCVRKYAVAEQKIDPIALRITFNPEKTLASAVQQTAIDVRATEADAIEQIGKELNRR